MEWQTGMRDGRMDEWREGWMDVWMYGHSAGRVEEEGRRRECMGRWRSRWMGG